MESAREGRRHTGCQPAAISGLAISKVCMLNYCTTSSKVDTLAIHSCILAAEGATAYREAHETHK